MLPGKLRLSQDVSQNIKIALKEFVKSPPPRLVRRDRIIFHPRPARVLIEIHTRIDSLINGVNVECGNLTRNPVGSWAGGRRVALSQTLSQTKNNREQQGRRAQNRISHTTSNCEVSPETCPSDVEPAASPNQTH